MGSFVVRHSQVELEFDDASLGRRIPGKLVQQRVDRNGHFEGRSAAANLFGETFQRKNLSVGAAARVVNQVTPHDSGGDSEKVAAIAKLDPLRLSQTQERFVDQSGRL